jgi:hypothetical protein
VSVLIAVSRTRSRGATLAELGWNRLARCLVALQLLALVAGVLMYRVTGLTLVWRTDAYWLVLVVPTMVAWLYFVWEPGSPREWLFAEAVFVFLLLLLFGQIAPPAQYGAVALKRPLIDPWLARMDARLGIDVRELVAWTGAHPSLVWLLRKAYLSLLPQFLLPMFLLPILRDREALWEYAFHFHVCSVVTLAAVAIWPVEYAFTFYGFKPLLPQGQAALHFAALRNGTLTTIRLDDMQGLVSLPSFHVAGALMVTWACRRSWFWVPLAVVNVLLSAATVMLGLHYATDLIATAAMCAGSLWMYRRWGQGLIAVDGEGSGSGKAAGRVRNGFRAGPLEGAACACPAQEHRPAVREERRPAICLEVTDDLQ